MKIGILQTGHPPTELAPTHGDYPSMFERLLGGRGFTFQTWSVVDGEFPAGPQDADGWLITGSRHGVYEDHPWIAPLEALVRDIIAAGKPLVGIRTASHAFALRNAEQPEGHDTWPGFDAEVWGGNYTGHHPAGPKTKVDVVQNAAGHPILTGLDLSQFTGSGSLYQNHPLKSSARPLLNGSIPDKPTEPIAWTSQHKGGGRAFYTSLGHKGDFQSEVFQQLLRNAIYWAAGLDVPAGADSTAETTGSCE